MVTDKSFAKARGRELSRPQALASGLTALVLLWMGPFACEDRLPEVSSEEGARVARIAEPAATSLLRTLVEGLTGAIQEGGSGYAIEYCSTEAIPLTRMVQAGLEGSLDLKRTSFRYRNPDNAPDEAEEEALRFFEDAILRDGEAPSHFVQRASEVELRYYRPIFVGEVCLRCHGARESLDEDVRSILLERYPEDLATGYHVGDFRGVVRVSVPKEQLTG